MTEHFSPAEIAALLEGAVAIIRAEVEALPKAVAIFIRARTSGRSTR